jgi:hypothetical protein
MELGLGTMYGKEGVQNHDDIRISWYVQARGSDGSFA